MLLLNLLSMFFAVFGVYAFTSQYTCFLVKWNGTLRNWCQRLFWIPSACVVIFVLGMTVFRSEF